MTTDGEALRHIGVSPLASLIVHGLIRFEHRADPISYRGPVAIHAAKFVDSAKGWDAYVPE